MVDYESEIRKEAVDFIDEVSDDFYEAMENDESYFVDGSVDDRFFECVTDRSYSLTDAAFIIENSNNVEDDSGLWEGKDPQDALEIQAAFTFANDVRSEVDEIYEYVKAVYDEKYSEVYDELESKHNVSVDEKPDSEGEEDDDYDPEEDAREAAKQFAEEYFQDEYHESVEIVTRTGDKIHMIERYLSLGGNAGMWSGYPCGSSYIDSRCGSGYGMPEIHDYVEFDHMISRAIPEISGKSDRDIRKYLEELKKEN